MSQKISINPSVLKWARETAHMLIEDVPKSIIDTEKLLKIEAGKDLPTLTQLTKLAKKYDRSLFVLIQNEIPTDDYYELPFFRKDKKNDYDSALNLLIRDIQRKQDWARNYLLAEGYDELDFIGSIRTEDDIKIVAKKIKDRLSIPSFVNFNTNEEYFKSIKENIENNHIFVSITGSDKSNKSISLEEAQGFAIADNFAPFVFVNTKNTMNAKIFTLLHEIVHLFINQSGITEDAIKFRKPQCNEDRIENFCNAVAGEILMPEKSLREKYNEYSNVSIRQKIATLSQYFLVSELAICVKLWKLNLLEYETYNKIYSEIEQEIHQYLKNKKEKQQESKRGGNYYPSMVSRNGKLLSQLALYAYQENKILGTDLFNILKVKLDKLNTYFSML